MFSVISCEKSKMEVNEKADILSHMYFLPDELISSILLYSDLRDIVNFSASCKRFNELLDNSNCLWKQKYRELIPIEFQKLVMQNKNEVNWLYELKHFYLLKKLIISELLKMSPQFYWKEAEASLEDIKPFFKLATLTYINYYYTVYILQEIVRETKKIIDKNTCLKPVNTLTITYYARKVLRHLIQTYLCIKWARHACHKELIPQVVVNFFIQWIDPDNIHADEDVEEKIQYWANQVKDTLNESTKNINSKSSKQHTEREILSAISDTIYKKLQVKVTTLDSGSQTLDIVKVIDDKHGSAIALGTIYQAVARILGVHCELKSFSNHFFLEWQCNEGGVTRKYTIDLNNGDLRPKRQCPYSRISSESIGGEKYNPGSFIQFIYTAYMQSKGTVQDWEYQNASHLYDFLSSHDTDNIHNPYKDFFVFLGRYAAAPALRTRIDIKCMEEEHRNLIMTLSDLNAPQESVDIVIVKKRSSELKYAVGMVCYHVQYYYMCVICDWETGGGYRPAVDDPSSSTQPTYTVITEDQCVRYVPQEKIKPLSQPHRIKTIEDLLGRDFTHFDGYVYVCNDEKIQEYPDDRCIVEEYINRLFTKRK